MSHGKIDHSDVPIRLFKSDFMEFFTHVSPITIMVIWFPVAIYALVRSILDVHVVGAWWHIPVGFIGGLFLWTFSEYILHRFLFHYPAKTPASQRIFFLFHGVHHAQPQLKTRLVMPPVVSIPLALVFYGLFYLIFVILLSAPQWIAPVFSAFITGYLTYDITHYATHHFPMKTRYLKFLRKYHMLHHFKTPEQRYGVTSPIWDRVFGTYPAE